MSIVSLVSGGLDSSVMALMIREEGLEQFPVFINYGQINYSRESKACHALFSRKSLPAPMTVNISGWGAANPCGITDASKRVVEDAFLPGRNLMFLLIAGSYAHKVGAGAVAIGLLDESKSIFPDQTRSFCNQAESILTCVLGRTLKVLTPLITFEKADVVRAAKLLDVNGTYSCHSGGPEPCGVCIACREYHGIEV